MSDLFGTAPSPQNTDIDTSGNSYSAPAQPVAANRQRMPAQQFHSAGSAQAPQAGPNPYPAPYKTAGSTQSSPPAQRQPGNTYRAGSSAYGAGARPRSAAGQQPTRMAAAYTQQPARAAGRQEYAGSARNAASAPRSTGGQQRSAGGGARRNGNGGSGRPPANGKGGGNGGNGGGRRSKQPSRGKLIFFGILKACFVLGCIGLVVAAVFAVNLCRFVIETTEDDENLMNLEVFQRSATSYIYALSPNNPNAYEEGDWAVYQTLTGDSNSVWADLDDIPQHIIDAAVATEDRDFWENDLGFSVTRTAYAALNEVLHFRSTFGGSTLDQQLVKNLTGENEVVGEDGDKSTGYERKAREIYRAWALNKNYTKEQIMEAYLNTMPLTGTIVGVRAAAYEYFNKELDELTLAQCAMIVGITNAPGRYSPYANPDNCLTRRNDVLYFMYQTDKITQAEFESACAEPLGLYTGTREVVVQGVNTYFSDAIYNAVTEDYMAQYGVSSGVAHYAFYNSGWKIYATIDQNVQSAIDEVYLKGYGDQAEGYIFPDIEAEVDVFDDEGNVTGTKMTKTQSAMVVIDYEGNMKGVVGGIGQKEESLSFNRAIDAVRQVGSTMKPIAAYALGIDMGVVDYSSLLTDEGVQPRNPSNPKINAETGEVVNDWPGNYGGEGGKGDPMILADALAKSINTVAVRIGMRVGIEEMFDFLVNTLQISSLVSEGGTNDLGLAPLVLGSMTNGISPLELAAAYQMFGNGGEYHSVHCYYEILDSNDNLVMRPNRTVIQAISEETAYVMNRLLSNVLGSSAGTQTATNGTARGMAPSYLDAVGKTGTTNEDNDRWFVGLTPYYVSAVWWGFDAQATLDGLWKAGAATNPPVMAWRAVMEATQANLPYKEFPVSSTVQQATFCRETGLLATAECTDTQTGYYTSERVPEECYVHGNQDFFSSDDDAA